MVDGRKGLSGTEGVLWHAHDWADANGDNRRRAIMHRLLPDTFLV